MLHCLDALNARKSERLPLSTGIFPKKRDLWFFWGLEDAERMVSTAAAGWSLPYLFLLDR